MINNFFKITLRNIKRFAGYSLLNITGMAIGMAAAILILLWVQDEWSYDRYINNARNVYRIIEKDTTSQGQDMMVPVPAGLAQTLKSKYPEVTRASRYTDSPLTLKKGDQYIEEMVAVVDKDFLKMFDFEFIAGDINSALDDPHNIILTEETAIKFFGKELAIGKTIPSRGYDVKVSGIIRNIPHNSHLKIDFLVPIEWLNEIGGQIDDWNRRFYTYVELEKGADSRVAEKKFSSLLKAYLPETQTVLLLQNIRKIHLYSIGKYAYDVAGHGNIIYVRIMGIIALFILIIACINFMSLASAQSIKRSKEAALRKISGSTRNKIIAQFLAESLLLVFSAHILAMIMVELFLPGFNSLTGKTLSIDYKRAGIYLELVVIVVTCGILAGIYPAIYLSSIKPLDIMKGMINNSPTHSKIRKILVIFQFTISAVLIICTMIIGLQLRFLQISDPGYNKDNIGYFMFPIRPGDPKLESLKYELSRQPNIIGVTKGFNPVNIEGSVNGFNWTGKKEGSDVSFCFVGADADFASIFQFKIKNGRFFSSDAASDSFAIVINEKAAELMGLKNPIGEIVTAPWGSRYSIIGVMKNFHFKSLHYAIEPLILHIDASNNFFVRMKPEDISSTINTINNTFKSFEPGLPMDFHFLEADFDNLYRAERRISKIFICFSLLAILISVLGLIGLSAFLTESRTKEIGIRKTNGAGSFEVFSILSGEYIKWVFYAFVISCPIAWYAMSRWLHGFAYRTHIPWWTFAGSGIVILVIAMLTVCTQSYYATTKNPVDALRYE